MSIWDTIYPKQYEVTWLAGAGGDDAARGVGSAGAWGGTEEVGVKAALARDSPSDDSALGEDSGVG